MIPIRLQLSGFLSYQQPVELDFTSFDLACISGQNGAGKSSLLDAITWALFGQARRNDEALINSHSFKSNDAENECRVIFEFEYESLIYRIDRSKKRNKSPVKMNDENSIQNNKKNSTKSNDISTKLEFQVMDQNNNWSPLTEHSIRETEASIEHTLRMDYDTFTNASFFLQGKADQFAQQKPSERKRILSNILGLEIWETYREQAASRRKKLDDELISLNSLVEEIENELKEEDARREKLKNLQETLNTQSVLRQSKESALGHLRLLVASLKEQKKMVDLLAQQSQAAGAKFEQKKAELQERMLEMQEVLSRLAEADQIESQYHHWLESKQKLEQWERIAADFRQHETQRNQPLMGIETEKARLEQEKQALIENGRTAEETLSQLENIKIDINRFHAQVLECSQTLEKAMQLRKDLEQILENQSEAQAENKHLRQEMSDLKERIDQLAETSGASCPLCGQPLEAEDRKKLVESLENQGRQMGDQYRRNQALVNEINQRREEIEKNTAAIPALENELRSQQRLLDQTLDRKTHLESLVKNWQENGLVRLSEVSRLLRENDFALEARRKLEEIDVELKKLGYDAASHDAVRKAELDGRMSQENYQKLEAARAGLAPLEREKNNLEAQIIQDEIAASEQEKSYRAALEKYQTDSSAVPDIDLAERDLLLCQEQENRIRMEVGAASQQVEVLKRLQTRKKDLTLQRENLQRQIGQIKILERAFGKDGIPALLIEQALPEIESQANDILERLSEGGMSVSFSTQKDYKDKNRDDKRETLDILISDGAGRREYEMFSGGEAFRVNFAIRLALSRVLAQRAGARLRTLVIDEGFGSQDADGRQRLIQAINLVQPDFAKILVITHLEELKDAFPARIEVEKNSNGSTLKVIT